MTTGAQLARATLAIVTSLREQVRALAAGEMPEDECDRLAARLGSSGIIHVEFADGDRGTRRILYRGPRFHGTVPVDGSHVSPITDALSRLAVEIKPVDLYARLRLAATDMSFVATAANLLAAVRRPRGDPRYATEDPHVEFIPVEEVLDVGIVVMYARSFTGKASLGGKWVPGDDDRFLVSYTRLPSETLELIAAMCKRQGERFERAALELEPQIELIYRPRYRAGAD